MAQSEARDERIEGVQTYRRICSICEAGCGLEVEAQGRSVVRIRPAASDVFSEGHACAKGIALKDLDTDPDRLKVPLIRRSNGFEEASWDEALTLIAERLAGIRAEHGSTALACYFGNPTAHNIGLAQGAGVFAGAMQSANIFSAATVDQIPKQVACELLFGNDMAIPVPDIERTDCLLMLGANPIVSNGSLWMVPKIRERIRTLKARGGSLITVDPRFTETSALADEHVYLRPGTDAWLLLAVLRTLIDHGRTFPERYPLQGVDSLLAAVRNIDVDDALDKAHIEPAVFAALITRLEAAQAPVCYGRIGTTLQEHGTLTSFLIEVVNILLGALDQPGGAMFPDQPFVEPRAGQKGSGFALGRYHSRVSKRPEVLGQFPLAVLAEEILEPGEGQIRALVTFAGNPAISGPDSEQMHRALAALDFMVSVDIYLNETTAHADVVLPGTSPFEDSHYDHFLGSMGYRNAARYSPALFPIHDQRPDEWSMGLAMTYGMSHGTAPDAQSLRAFEDDLVAGRLQAHCEDPDGPLFGRDVQELLSRTEYEQGVERLLEIGVRAGPWGDHFGERDGLTLKQMEQTPDGIDLGLPKPRLADIVRHEDGLIPVFPDIIRQALERLLTSDVSVETGSSKPFALIGRRNVNTNNSWLNNLSSLAGSTNRCVLEMNQLDAQELGLQDQDEVEVRSESGMLRVPIVASDKIARSVVSMPHGYSDRLAGMQTVASARGGANYNTLAPLNVVDEPSGTSALNGIAVSVKAV